MSLDDLQVLEVGGGGGGDDDDDSANNILDEQQPPQQPGTIARVAPPPTFVSPSIFDLINARRWDAARGYIDLMPSCVYEQNGSQHRTPLHVLCRMKFGGTSNGGTSSADSTNSSRSSSEGSNNGSSEDGDGDDDDRHDDFDGALAVARLLIETSHHGTVPSMALHPVGDHGEYDRALHNSVLTVQDVYGDTPLHCICGNLHRARVELARLVLENTADYVICSSDDDDGRDGKTMDTGDEAVKGDAIRRRTRTDGRALPTVYHLLSDQNYHGCTPVHFCADGGCTAEVIDLILDACYGLNMGDVRSAEESPVNVKGDATSRRFKNRYIEHPMLLQDEDGDTPLHFACSAGLEPDVLRRMITQKDIYETYLPIQIKTYGGRLPVDDLITWCIDEYGIESNELNPPLEERMTDEVTDALWSRIEVLLEAADKAILERIPMGENQVVRFRPLHAAASMLSFPAIVLRMACIRFGAGGGFLEQDEVGRTPLHRAVERKDAYQVDGDLYSLGSGEYLDLSRWNSEYERRSPIEYLVYLCPETLRVRCQRNRLPIHYAVLNSGEFSDIEAMLALAPEGLAQRDGYTGLLPFMLAASDETDHYDSSLDRSFNLLLLNPELVRDPQS